jgi:hypothetical protein
MRAMPRAPASPTPADSSEPPARRAAPAVAAMRAASLPDDRFIPVQAHDLIESLARHAAHPEEVARLLGLIEDIIHQEATALERHITRLYAMVNPDRETVRRDTTCAIEDAHREVEACVYRLLEKANFHQLSEVEIEDAIRAANSHGLRIRVQPEMVESLAVWIRGPATATLCRRMWQAPVRGKPVEIPIYRRLVVMARLRGSTDIILKLFRDIPVADIEALLPHATVGMSWLDRAIIFGGGAGGFGPIVVKLFTGAAIVGASRLVAVAAGVMMVRSFFGYRRTRLKRDSQRTKSLYFQNMANNAAVIHKFISLITEEEIKEAALACALLWGEVAAEGEGPSITSRGGLQAAAEAYIRHEFGARADFDIEDAIETIDRLELWADRARLRLLPPAAAADILLRHRSDRRSWSYHISSLAEARAGEPKRPGSPPQREQTRPQQVPLAPEAPPA